jgi:hypothetical protein
VRVSLARALNACLAEESDDGTEMNGYVMQLQTALESLGVVAQSSDGPGGSCDQRWVIDIFFFFFCGSIIIIDIY